MEQASEQPFSPEPVDITTAGWERWLRRLEHCIAAKDSKDSNPKKAMLVHCCGTRA